MAKSKSRMSNEVNAGSMADIAFLLLIFFLVTTTIAEDSGVLVLLPPWSEAPPETEQENKRNVYSVLVNGNDQLLVRGEVASLETLKQNTINFITNPNNNPNFAVNPQKAIVSIQNDRGTSYKTYLGVYNEVKAAYNDIWDAEGQRIANKNYEFLDKELKKRVRTKYPLNLSEAEPTAFGDEE